VIRLTPVNGPRQLERQRPLSHTSGLARAETEHPGISDPPPGAAAGQQNAPREEFVNIEGRKCTSPDTAPFNLSGALRRWTVRLARRSAFPT
jgi:hypothetical protein